MLAALTGVQTPVRAEIVLNIRAQPLGDALNEFARQTGLQVVLFTEVSEGITTRHLEGAFTPRTALELLLRDTGLELEYINERTIAVRSAQSDGPTQSSKSSAPRKTSLSGSVVLAQAPAWGREEAPPSRGADSGSPTLEEIIVTAEKRALRIQDLPIAVSAYSGETLSGKGIDNVSLLQQIAPSLQVQSTLNSYANVTIRGIGSHIQNIQAEPSVSISQDGVTYSDLELANLDFFDVERVEVLRGPQGTLGGRNATAGAINIHSKRPTSELEGGFKATLGNYHRMALKGHLSGPIAGERLLGRFAVRSDRDDGWLEVVNQGTRLGNRDKVQARASFLARLADQVDAHLILEVVRDKSRTPLVDAGRVRPDQPSPVEVFGVPAFDWGRRTIALDAPQAGKANLERNQGVLKLSWELAPSTTLSATTAYVDQYLRSSHDLDGSAIGGFTYDPLEPLIFDIQQFSQEINLLADLSERLDVIVGAQYLQTSGMQQTTFGLPELGVPFDAIHNVGKRELESLAAYTQWRYRLSDGVRLTAGSRYTHDSKDAHADRYAFGSLSGSRTDRGSWSAWTPRVAIELVPNDELTVYASVSRGFKSGGLAMFVDPPNPFKPEVVWNYETGVKSSSLDGRLRTAVTGFYMDYTDLQQVLSGVDPDFPQRSRILNAESATLYGVEVELEALLTARLRLNLTGTWIDATYGELSSHDPIFPELGAPVVAGGLNVRDANGNRVMLSPQWQFNVSGEYRAPLLGTALQAVTQLSYTWQDQVFHDIFNNDLIAQDAFGIVNLSAALETDDGKWQLALHANNLTDEFDRANLLYLNLPTGHTLVSNPGRPRSYGASLAYRF